MHPLPAPAVSVLMPCYNTAGTLEEALQSIATQTLTDFEVVVVDDGSTDATPHILQRWAAQDSRFTVLRIPHTGITAALNAGLARCRAPFVARMDSDDRSAPERLALQAGYLAAHPSTAVVSCRVQGFPEGQVRLGFQLYLEWLNSLVSDADIRREIFIESPVAHPSVMFRREAVRAVGGYQERGWAEDYDLWLRLYLRGAVFAKLPETLFEWREHPERLTRTDSRYSLENFLRAKAHYLVFGPLQGRKTVFLWGAGMIGRRLSKHLLRLGAPLEAFIDIDPQKIGHTRRGFPILSPQAFFARWQEANQPILLACVGARGARQLIRDRLAGSGLQEGQDWWSTA
jgi:glycosyltransferase involved in cell wall biosynthesis